jgi:UDP-glucose 4-epimerase
MKRILVTGGAGFIGSHTVDLLLSQGLEVVVIDNLSTGKLTYLNLFNPNLRFVQGDVRDESLLRRELARCDAVLHLAALPSVPQSIENPVESLRINTEGFICVLQAIRCNHKPVRLVYASSASVYGNSEVLPCSDERLLPALALSPYALEKATNERYAATFDHLFGIKSLGLRYFNVYGNRQDPGSPYSGVISKFIAQYKTNLPITLFGDGLQSRDFIHVSDVARANCLALREDVTGVINIATGVAETLLNMITYMEKAGQHKAEILFANSRKGDIVESYACVAKAVKELNFRHSIPLENGMSAMVGVTSAAIEEVC